MPKKFQSKELLNEIIRILDKHDKNGWDLSRSGQLKLNGRDYAKDIISAVYYVRSLLVDDDSLTIDSAIQLIESHKDDYESIYIDPEGFGCGTLNDIISDIEALDDESRSSSGR